MNAVGVKAENVSHTVVKTEMKSEAAASQDNSGLDLLASLAPFCLSIGGPVIGCIICCIICCVICIAIFVLPKLFGGKSDKEATDTAIDTSGKVDQNADEQNVDEQKGGFLYNLFTDTFSDSFNVLSKQYLNNYHYKII